jgi:glycosyltransferase involved in cell wall biosynthesis
MVKVSVVIPIYNVAPYIENCLHSVMTQTYQGIIECLLVDDCGTDDSMTIVEDIIDNYAGPIQFKILRHEHNMGISAARNTGINAATGDYLYFLDSDDEMTPDCLTLLVEPLKKKSYDFVMGDAKPIGFGYHSKLTMKEETLGVKNIARSFSSNNWHCVAWNKLYNKKYIQEHGIYFKEGILHEDELWGALIACTAESMFFVTKETYLHYKREGSIMGTDMGSRKLSYYMAVLKGFYEYQESNKLCFEGIENVERRLKNLLIIWCSSHEFSSFKVYSNIRHCDVRSCKTRNMLYRSTKSKLIHLDEYLPILLGYVYKRILKLIMQ